jgi:quercetin dioxygenase-like cupin family protein
MSDSDNHTDPARMQRMLDEMKGRNLWDELFALRDRQRNDREKSVWRIRGKDIPWENNKQGLMRWYLHPLLNSTCINTLKLFVQEIPPGSRSGRLHHPGNQVIYIMEGRGYTTIDGQKHQWNEGDVVMLPLRTKGVTVQHFNANPDKRVRFVACEPNAFLSIGVDRGSGFEQIEVSPDYKA